MLFESLGFSVSFLLPFMDKRGMTEEKLKQQLVKKEIVEFATVNRIVKGTLRDLD